MRKIPIDSDEYVESLTGPSDGLGDRLQGLFHGGAAEGDRLLGPMTQRQRRRSREDEPAPSIEPQMHAVSPPVRLSAAPIPQYPKR